MAPRSCLLVAASAALGVVAQEQNWTELVYNHVAANASSTFQNASGFLKFKYLIPGGYYQQLWDWDSMFLGIATLSFGSQPYLEGSMLNFISQTNLTTGEVKGCLTPDGQTLTLYHAKPLLIQAAWLASKAPGGDPARFQAFEPQMQALLAYWNNASRFDATTGLYYWHDQLETGADNLVLSQCPSDLSPECWNEAVDAFTLASPDLQTWMHREYTAYALFLQAWASASPVRSDYSVGALSRAADARARAATIRTALDTYLWNGSLGYYTAWNRTTASQIFNRTWELAFPVWAGLANATQADSALRSVRAADMWTPFGIASTSTADPRYNNDHIVNPYSNWRGPIWVNVNALTAFALVKHGFESAAAALADNVVRTLGVDLVVNGQWHEAYSSATGEAIAAPGFYSWNTLGALLQANVAAGIDPFQL